MTSIAELWLLTIIISTHTLTWSVTHCNDRILHTVDFNSHAHVERDSITIESFQNNDYFNSHAHVERDLDCGTLAVDYNHFNSHAHVERDWTSLFRKCRKAYFNSHAHVERDDFKIRIISATVAISTHTLTWSVTLAASSTISIDINFNSHAHVERDLCTHRQRPYC